MLALALGFFASVYVYRNLQAKPGASSEPGIEVIVAANDLQVGARVEEHDIKIISDSEEEDLPPGAPRRRADVLGHGVIIPIARGEFILPNRLAGENAGSGLPALIPPGMRAVSVRVTDVVSVAGFVTPGTRVDVLLTGTPGQAANSRRRPYCRMWRCLRPGTPWNEHLPARPRIRPSSRCWFLLTMLSGSHWPAPKDAFNSPFVTRWIPSRTKYRLPIPEASTGHPRPRAGAIHHTHVVPKKVAPPTTTRPDGVSVEVYQGDKKPEIVKCSEENCGAN